MKARLKSTRYVYTVCIATLGVRMLIETTHFFFLLLQILLFYITIVIIIMTIALMSSFAIKTISK